MCNLIRNIIISRLCNTRWNLFNTIKLNSPNGFSVITRNGTHLHHDSNIIRYTYLKWQNRTNHTKRKTPQSSVNLLKWFSIPNSWNRRHPSTPGHSPSLPSSYMVSSLEYIFQHYIRSVLHVGVAIQCSIRRFLNIIFKTSSFVIFFVQLIFSIRHVQKNHISTIFFLSFCIYALGFER